MFSDVFGLLGHSFFYVLHGGVAMSLWIHRYTKPSSRGAPDQKRESTNNDSRAFKNEGNDCKLWSMYVNAFECQMFVTSHIDLGL